MKRGIFDFALRMSLAYLALAAVWILVSDRILLWLIPDPLQMAQVQSYKGWFFVLATASLLYVVLRRRSLLQARSMERINDLAKFPSEDPNPILRLSPDGRILYGNHASDLILKNWDSRIGDHAPPDWQEWVADTLANNKSKKVDVTYDNRTFAFDIVPIASTGYVNLYGRDVTDRKWAEGEVRTWSQAVAQSPVSVVVTDVTGAIEFVNPKFTAVSGYTFEEVRGKNPRFLRSGHTSNEEYKTLWETITSSREWHGELLNKAKDGTLFWEATAISPITDERGAITHFIAIKEDITEQKRAEQQINRQLQQLRALRAIDIAISSSLDMRVTLDVLLEQVISQLHVDAAAILLLNQPSLTLEYAAGRGFHSSALRHTHLRVGQGLAGRAALERQTIRITHLNDEQGPLSEALSNAHETFKSYVGVPLIAKGQVKGVLEVFQSTVLEPDEEWLEFLEALAGQAAIAIDDEQLFQSVQRANADLMLAYDATLEGWSRALDLRDKETEGHSKRVTEVTLQLARAVNMNDLELVNLRRGALLHDIGKMGVPDAILLKPGPLTDEEWQIMRQHPVAAYELLSPITYLQAALDIPYCHHEKWDGTGYPRGLKGEEIPLAARLFAVVDVWDALCSNRPYRAAWPETEVLAYIKASAGTHFDPQAVEVFFGVINQAQA